MKEDGFSSERWMVCSKCGSRNVDHGKVFAAGRGLEPDRFVQVKVKGVGDLLVRRALCFDCGHLEFYVKGDVKDKQVKKIVGALKGVFESWPRRDQISLKSLSQRVNLSEDEILRLVSLVRQKYRSFRMEQISNEQYFIKEKY